MYLSTYDITNRKHAIIERIFEDSSITSEEWIRTIAYIINRESDKDILRMIALKVHLNINGLFTKDIIIRQECAKTILCAIEIAPNKLIIQDIIEKISSLDFNLFRQLYSNLTLAENSKNKSRENIAAGILLRHSIVLALDIDDEVLLHLDKLSFVLTIEPCPLILTSAIQAIKISLQIKQDAYSKINWQRLEDILAFAKSNKNKDLITEIIELKELCLTTKL